MSYVIREFRDADAFQIVTLFYETIHSVNLGDYTEEQVEAWAPTLSLSGQEERVERFRKSLGECISFVADSEGIVIGFADMTESGYLDFMFVHKDYQRRGVASSLLRALEQQAVRLGVNHMWANVSVTAKPFFERHGYGIVQPQTVHIRGVAVDNFKMEKTFV